MNGDEEFYTSEEEVLETLPLPPSIFKNDESEVEESKNVSSEESPRERKQKERKQREPTPDYLKTKLREVTPLKQYGNDKGRNSKERKKVEKKRSSSESDVQSDHSRHSQKLQAADVRRVKSTFDEDLRKNEVYGNTLRRKEKQEIISAVDSDVSISEPSDSEKEERRQSKSSSSKRRSEIPQVATKKSLVRDSMIDLMLDPRKLRKTPLNEVDAAELAAGIIEVNDADVQTNDIPPERKFTSYQQEDVRKSLSRSSLSKFTPEYKINSTRKSRDKIYKDEDVLFTPKSSIQRGKTSSRSSSNSNAPLSEQESSEEEKPRKSSLDKHRKKTSSSKKPRKKSRGDELRERIAIEQTKEKRELLFQFWLMENQGIPVMRKYVLEDSIDDMRFEYHRVKAEGDIKEKIKIGWSIFSCVSSLGEMLNQRIKPFGISLEGWSDDLDSQRQEYEVVFRKIYKNMASKFYIRPGLQLMMMFGSQLLTFLAPRIMKKLQSKEPKESYVQELDESGNPIHPESIKKIDNLSESVKEMRNQLAEQTSRFQQQQIMMLQSQQVFFDKMATMIGDMRKNNEMSLYKSERVSKPTVETTKTTNPIEEPSDSEYEWVEEEVTDSESELKDATTTLQVPSQPIVQEVKKAATDFPSLPDDAAAAALGNVMSTMQPLVNLFRQVKKRDMNVPLNTYMYDEKPIVPKSMRNDVEKLKMKGLKIEEEGHEEEEDEVRNNVDTKTKSSKNEPLSGYMTQPQVEARNNVDTTTKSSKKLETWDID